MSHVIKALHFSGRYSKSPAAVEKDVSELVKAHDLLTFTEFEINARLHALKERGFTLVHVEDPKRAGEDGEAMLFRKSRFDVLHTAAEVLTNLRYEREGGATTPPCDALVAVVSDKLAQKTLLVIATHLPAHVQGNGGFYTTIVQQRVKVYRDAVKGLKRVKKQYKKQYKPDEVIVIADWNLDIGASWVRAYLKMNFPRLHPNFEAPYPTKGSLGHRNIDIALTSMQIVRRAQVLMGFPSSDHRPVEYTLGYRR